jgi:signal transduction histidine kinase
MNPYSQEPMLPELTRRLRLKESLLEAHINASSDGLIAISMEGDVWHLNRGFREMWGNLRLEGKPRCDVEVWPGVLAQLQEPKRFLDMLSMLTSYPLRGWESQLITRAGRIIDCFSTPVIDGPGVSSGRLWTFRDVTEKYRAQEELHRTRRRASVGQFGCSIAHDFRNLLLAIAGYSQMLAAAVPDDHSAHQHAREILRATQHGRSLIEHLLAFTSGRASGRRLLSIGAVLQDTLGLLRFATDRSIVLHTETDEALPLVLADAIGLQQILINLVINAAQAIHCEKGRIEIRVTRHAGSFVRLSVSDNGKGMSPDVIERAFEPFFSGRSDHEGIGLGLAIVQEIVASHRGLISVSSTVGEGTTFLIDFPVAPTPPDPDA